MPDIKIATVDEIPKLSELSVRLGNGRFFSDRQPIVSFFEDEEGISGFASVQKAWLATGSWVKEEFRRQGHTYQLRAVLDNELRRQGVQVYFALPVSDFEKALFAKYGTVTEHLAQMRHL